MFKKYNIQRCRVVLNNTSNFASVGDGRVLRRSDTNEDMLIYEHLSRPVVAYCGDLFAVNCRNESGWTGLIKEGAEILGIGVEVKRQDGIIRIKHNMKWRTEKGDRILIRLPQASDQFRPSLVA